MDNLIFYKDSIIGRELAFILGIPYKYADTISFATVGNCKMFIENYMEEPAIARGLVRGKNYVLLDDICDYLDQFSRVDTSNECRDIEKIEKKDNNKLTAAEMLIKVLYSKPLDIDCKTLLEEGNIDDWGNVWGCCPGWIEIPFANVLHVKDVFDDYFTRMIRLSCLNKSFCFCNLKKCKYYGSKKLDNYSPTNFDTPKYPERLIISIDKTCNLRCESCRKKAYIPTKKADLLMNKVTDKVIEQDLLTKSTILMAGQGEVFLSKRYLKMLNSIDHGKAIIIMTNGVLFNEEKWKLLENKFNDISFSISIDAATKETYTKLRHGPFDILLKNLELVAKLRKEEKISFLTFNFVVQRDNMHEMVDFVKLAKKCNVDRVQFTRLNDWNTFKNAEFKSKSLIDGDYIDKELYEILKDPIFKDPIVDIDFLKVFIENSKKIYE